jgi:hypothetical protein
MANFIYSFQTKPSICHMFARSQLVLYSIVLISAVSVRIYQLQFKDFNDNFSTKKYIIFWENNRSSCKGNEQLGDVMLGCYFSVNIIKLGQ